MLKQAVGVLIVVCTLVVLVSQSFAAGQPTVSWTEVSGSTWYQLWINRGGSAYYTVWLNQTATNWTAANDFPGGTYSWWTKSWSSGAGYGTWVAGTGFVMPSAVPGKTTLIGPSGTVSTNRPVFIWTSVSNAAWYKVWINSGGSQYAVKWVQGTTQYVHSVDLPAGAYTWWVQTWSADGYGPWSDSSTFECNIAAPLFPIGAKIWDKRYGGFNHDNLRQLAQTSDGGFILGGDSISGSGAEKTEATRGGRDYWMVKTDGLGAKLWDRRFGGSDTDELKAIQQTSDGGYILAGYSKSGISGDRTEALRGGYDYWIVKTDTNGVVQWDKRYGSSVNDYLLTAQQTSDGGYLLGGSTSAGIDGDKSQASQGGLDYWVVKTDSAGALQWDRRFGGTGTDYLLDLQQTSDGGYILGGYSTSGASGDKSLGSRGGYDFWVVKTDTNGVAQWDMRYGGASNDLLLALQQTSDGGYIFGGESLSGAQSDRTEGTRGMIDYWIIKTDSSGNPQWDKRYGGAGDDNLTTLVQTSDGGYLVSGSSTSGADGDRSQATRGGQDYWSVKVDTNGVVEWDSRCGGSGDDMLLSAIQCSNGSYLYGGYTDSGADGDKSEASRGGSDFWIVKQQSKRPEFCWNKVQNATWYHIWIESNGSTYYKSWLNQGSNTWLATFDFATGDYTWWVRGWSPTDPGVWSSSENFSVP